ncbi:MAG: hypothetical protein CHACPFDD_03360 [Phycisphaerae bacterium]|nr:hypothetical protein [Phycisphaerae bacterium]
MTRWWLHAITPLAVCLLLAGCPQQGNNDGDDDGTGGTTDGTGGSTDGAAGDVSSTALSFGGSVSGNVDSVSTTSDAGDSPSARKLRSRAIATNATGWFTDLNGDALLDANGEPYPSFSIATDGSFSVSGLPVGVDIVLNVDFDGDGDADLKTIVNIPATENSTDGALTGVVVDPLSTLIHAKIRAMLVSVGLDPREFELSLSGLVARIRDAFENLFSDSGVDEEITIDELLGLADDVLASLFDTVIPDAARRAMDMAAANVQLSQADTVDDVVVAAAQIMLRGGFVIADDAGGIDLSFLGSLPAVQKVAFQDFHFEHGDDAAQGVPVTGPDLYYSTISEFDRNFPEEDLSGGPGRGPIFSEHILTQLAQLFLDGKTIDLSGLHAIVVNLEYGMGARYMFVRPNGPGEPPSEVFLGIDGNPVEVNLGLLHEQIQMLGMFNFDGNFEQHKADVRKLMIDFLAPTAEPSFDEIYAGILLDRVPSLDEFARFIRAQRAHLPFSRSGPAQVFALATEDGFQNPNAAPVTVDIIQDSNGSVSSARFISNGTGGYFLGFANPTPGGQAVEFIDRRNGRPLHNRKGIRQIVDVMDGSVFETVNGEAFGDAFSQTFTGYPGAPALRIQNPDFDPSQPADPETNPPNFSAFVLMDQFGPDGEPVQVDFVEGVATYNPEGTYFVMFLPDSNSTGFFQLISPNGAPLQLTPGDETTNVLISPTAILGITLAPETSTHFFGTHVANPGYDADGAPYYDDFNNNNVQDAGEPVFDFREFLHNPADWRSTFVERYYRRADNNGFPAPQDIDWQASTPKLLNGVALVARNLKPRLNAFRFGRPNVTVNLLAAFAPPEFFNGANALNGATRVNPFMSLALLNLVFGSIHNVEAPIDFDGPGPLPLRNELVNADLFVLPIGDPLQLIVDGIGAVAH